MIYERGADFHFANGKLHLAQVVNVHPRGELTHRNRKEWRFHRLGEDFAERRTGAVKPENADFVVGIVRGLKEGQSLDVVPMRVSNQQRQLNGTTSRDCPSLS